MVPGQMTSFPTPEDVVARSVEELRGVGLSGRKVEYGTSSKSLPFFVSFDGPMLSVKEKGPDWERK